MISPSHPTAAAAAPTRPKPKLRGLSHEFACYAAAMAGCYLVAQARGPGSSNLALIGTTLYSMGLFFQFAVSALYHRPTWSPAARARMRRLDHTAIYLLIAGTTTPVILLGLTGGARTGALALVWVGAALGVLKALLWLHAPKPLSALVYVLLASAIAPYAPELARAFGSQNLALLGAGGALYIVGAAIYALKRPDPLPAVFGYHEIFHALVIAAAALHYSAILQIVQTVAKTSGY